MSHCKIDCEKKGSEEK